MIKKLIVTTLLATLPITTIFADTNATQNSQKHYNPFRDDPFFQDFQRLQDDMDRVFENFQQRSMRNMQMTTSTKLANGFGSGFSASMRLDVSDKGDNYEVITDLPGMDKSNIKVKIENQMLSIDAKNEQKNEKKENNKIIRQERFFGSFHRSMSIPKDANGDKMTTKYKDGVLTITIPKKKK